MYDILCCSVFGQSLNLLLSSQKVVAEGFEETQKRGIKLTGIKQG